MRKTIVIDGKEVELKATASTLRRYRNWFNRDLLKDFSKLYRAYQAAQLQSAETGVPVELELSGDAIEMIQDLTYVMARQADSSVPTNVDDWLDQFGTFEIEKTGQVIIELWLSSLQSDGTLKNA